MAKQNDPGAVRQAALEYLRKKGLKPTGGNLSRAMEFLSKADTPLPRANAAASREETTKKTAKKSKSGKKAKTDDDIPMPPNDGRKPLQEIDDPMVTDTPDQQRFMQSADDMSAYPGLDQTGGPIEEGLGGSASPLDLIGGAPLIAALLRAKMGAGRASTDAQTRGMGMMPQEGEIMPREPLDQFMPMQDRARIPFTMDAQRIDGGDRSIGYDGPGTYVQDDPTIFDETGQYRDTWPDEEAPVRDPTIDGDFEIDDYKAGLTQGGPYPTQQQPMQQIPYTPSSPVAQGGPFPMGMQPGQNEMYEVLRRRAMQEAMRSGVPRSQVPIDEIIPNGATQEPNALLRAFLGALGGKR